MNATTQAETTAIQPAKPKVNPITQEVVTNSLIAYADEMALALCKSAYNMMIYEVRDFCTALLAPNGDLVSQNVGGVSHFVADLGVIVVDGMKRYGGTSAGRSGASPDALPPRPLAILAAVSNAAGTTVSNL